MYIQALDKKDARDYGVHYGECTEYEGKRAHRHHDFWKTTLFLYRIHYVAYVVVYIHNSTIPSKSAGTRRHAPKCLVYARSTPYVSRVTIIYSSRTESG